jgi:hypothetical protein
VSFIDRIRETIIRLSLVGLPAASPRKSRIPIFVVPSNTVNAAGVRYIFDMMNLCQRAFRFHVTDSLELHRKAAIGHAAIEYLGLIPRRTADIEISGYITQFDFYPQIEAFLEASFGTFRDPPGGGEPSVPRYISNSTLVIFVGREKFIWDEPGYTVTGYFHEDGYTLLYNNDESNLPGLIATYNNISVMSITKLTALPDIELELSRKGGYEEMAINDRSYVVSNAVHFLAERVFNRTIASEHVSPCILRQDLTGGLFTTLTTRELCKECSDKIYEAGAAPRASRSFSCDELIVNLEAMTRCLDRLESVKETGNRLKLAASAAFGVFGVSMVSNVLANYTDDITFIALVKKYLHPLEVALFSITAGVLLLAGVALCVWVSPRKWNRI